MFPKTEKATKIQKINFDTLDNYHNENTQWYLDKSGATQPYPICSTVSFSSWISRQPILPNDNKTGQKQIAGLIWRLRISGLRSRVVAVDCGESEVVGSSIMEEPVWLLMDWHQSCPFTSFWSSGVFWFYVCFIFLSLLVCVYCDFDGAIAIGVPHLSGYWIVHLMLPFIWGINWVLYCVVN